MRAPTALLRDEGPAQNTGPHGSACSAGAAIINAVNIALKEWAVVIEALARGRQHFLLRKGGISEGKRGFEVKHSAFLLYPTWEHQQADSIRPEFRTLFEQLRPKEDGQLALRYFARVSDVLLAPGDIQCIRAMREQHIWADPYLEMRYQYRPDLPLFVMILRFFQLPQIVQIPDDRRYRGCRSWVTLDAQVDVTGSEPVESDSTFDAARKLLLTRLSVTSESGTTAPSPASTPVS